MKKITQFFKRISTGDPLGDFVFLMAFLMWAGSGAFIILVQLKIIKP